VPILERALELREALADHDPVLLAETRWALARALAATGTRDRARTLAVAAHAGVEDPEMQAEIDAFLARRAR